MWSAKAAAPVSTNLRHIGLDDVFGPCLLHPYLGKPKPAPDIYLRAAADFGVAPARVAVIEDTVTGVAGGVAAGMRARLRRRRRPRQQPPPARIHRHGPGAGIAPLMIGFNRPDLVIFDCDGVLVESEVANRVFAEMVTPKAIRSPRKPR